MPEATHRDFGKKKFVVSLLTKSVYSNEQSTFWELQAHQDTVDRVSIKRGYHLNHPRGKRRNKMSMERKKADIVSLMMVWHRPVGKQYRCLEQQEQQQWFANKYSANLRCFGALARDLGAESCLDNAVKELRAEELRVCRDHNDSLETFQERKCIVQKVIRAVLDVRDALSHRQDGWWFFVCVWGLHANNECCRYLHHDHDHDHVAMLHDVFQEVARSVCRRTVFEEVILERVHSMFDSCIHDIKLTVLHAMYRSSIPQGPALSILKLLERDALCFALLAQPNYSCHPRIKPLMVRHLPGTTPRNSLLDWVSFGD